MVVSKGLVQDVQWCGQIRGCLIGWIRIWGAKLALDRTGRLSRTGTVAPARLDQSVNVQSSLVHVGYEGVADHNIILNDGNYNTVTYVPSASTMRWVSSLDLLL